VATRQVHRPPEGRQDFAVDAADLADLLDARSHIVAHSYGVLGTLIAATLRPARVRSLTLIEPPLYYLAPGDSEVARLERMGNAVLTHGVDTDAATLREFLRLAGAPDVEFAARTAAACRPRHAQRSRPSATPASRRWWPRATTRPGWSRFATPSPWRCAPSD
jgi:pimeloyl-ACP methyl ester carboxylesterase